MQRIIRMHRLLSIKREIPKEVKISKLMILKMNTTMNMTMVMKKLTLMLKIRARETLLQTLRQQIQNLQLLRSLSNKAWKLS